METRANYLLVGGFVLALIVGFLVFVVWFAKFQFDVEFRRYQIVFKGSVTGLSPGSHVRYSGVRVGEVIEVRLDRDNPQRVRTTIEVETGTPIRQDTVASLELQGLTGGLYVLLSGGSADAPPLEPRAGEKFAVISSRASSLEQVLAGAPDVLEGANLLLARANRLLSDENTAHFGQALANISRLTGTLADQSTQIDTLFADAAKTMTNLREASASVAELAGALKGDSTRLMSQASDTLAATENLADALGRSADSVKTDVNALVEDLRGTATATTGMAREIEALVAENREPLLDFTSGGLYDITNMVAEVRDILVGLNRVTTEVERDPARFLFGNQQQGYEPAQ
jgi:phospholipid/cholesterol/gamma-HCH transport system substrate-binding protein